MRPKRRGRRPSRLPTSGSRKQYFRERDLKPRPRERLVIASASEAIRLDNHNWMASPYLDCFVAFAPRNDGVCIFALQNSGLQARRENEILFSLLLRARQTERSG